MRRWGLLVSAVYLLLLYVFFAPLWSMLIMGQVTAQVWFIEDSGWSLEALFVLVSTVIIPIVGLLLSQLVLFVSVDRSFRRPNPRASLKRTVWATALATGLLTAGVLISFTEAIDTAWESHHFGDVGYSMLLFSWIPAWVIWSLLFNRYIKDEASLVHKMLSRLLAGSVLELLIAVPCHVYVRQKEDCSAGVYTGWGIITGLAVLLVAVGPSVYLLYRKQLQQYKKPMGKR